MSADAKADVVEKNMKKTVFKIAKMDCPCEENLIRMKLDGISGIVRQEYDLSDRMLTLYYEGDIAPIKSAIASLSLGSSIIETTEANVETPGSEVRKQKTALWWVLAINAVFFIIEMTTGLISKSMGLVADSLDMLADALVYGMSLMAVGAAVSRKKKVALYSGILQLALALLGLTEVIRRFIGAEQMPHFQTMIGISLFALIANSICLWLLQRTKSKDAHIRASVIFSANDVIINIGVIAAGFLVWISGSQIPDLIIGLIVFAVVIRGAIRILKLSK